MSTNDPQRKIPTPADLDPNRAAEMRAAAVEAMNQAIAEEVRKPAPAAELPTPADVAPAIAPPEFVRPSGVELSEEQRIRVEALHAARRVLGTPYIKDGQMPAGWAWQVIELASYIVTGDADGAAEEDEDQPAATGQWVDLNKPLPADLPPAVASALQKLQGAFRPGGVLPGPLASAERAREYVEGYLDKPEGLKELNAQGFYPVEGSEPPRSEPLHDVDCHRWSFDTAMGQWVRDTPLTEDEHQRNEAPSRSFGTWGSALAEFGPFHVCI
jgi:hypothetical protein